MWLIKMSWKNLWRNRSRTMIAMAAIVFAVILSTIASSLKDGIFDNLVRNVVSFYTGYIQVHKDGYWNEQILENSFTASAAIEQSILTEQNISGVTARLESFALVSSGDITKGSLVMGINPRKENQITWLESRVTQGHYLLDDDNAVLLAQGLAKRLQLKTGDTILLIGQGYHGGTAAGKYPVKGLLKFGSPDLNDKTLVMPLALAQDFYSAYGMVTSYVLSMKDPRELSLTASSVGKKLGKDYEVMTWEEILPEIKQHIETDSGNMKYVQGILYLLVCFGIFGTLVMMMVERRFEMGMLVAIGMKKGKLAGLLLFESVFTVVAGCLAGMIISIPIVYYLKLHPVRIGGETAKAYERFGFEAIFPTSISASNFIDQGMAVLAIGLLLSVYPIYKVISLNPVTSMKQ